MKMICKVKLIICQIIIVCMLLWSSAAGQTNTWTGATNLNWNTNTNWSLNLVPIAAHDVVINTNAAITLSANGVAGTLTISNNSTVSFAPSGGAVTLTLNAAGATLGIQAGSVLTINGRNAGGNNRMSLLFAAGAGKTGTIAGVLNINVAGNNDEGIFNSSNSTTTVAGSIFNNGGTIISTTTNLSFSSGGTYEHLINGGAIPAATWNAASNCNISGVTANYPSGIDNQTLGNLTWNCPAQTVSNTPGNIVIAGNLLIQNTGTGQFRFGDPGTNTIGGNYTQSGGTVRIGSNTARIVTINGNLSLIGGTLLLSDGNNTGTLNVAGNFSHTSGTISETSTGNAVINFNGSGIQTFTGGTGIVSGNNINYAVINATATLQMAAEATILNGTTFTLPPGSTLGIRSANGIIATGGGATGNIQVTGARNFNSGANYLYNGSGPQNIGSGLATNLTGDLIINNPGNTVTLNVGKTVDNLGVINLVDGTFAAGINLTINSIVDIFRSEGSMTASSFGGTGIYNLTYTGLSKTTGAEFLGGLSLPVRVNNVTINLTGSASLTMGPGIAIPLLGVSGSAMNGTLILINGLINTGLTNGLLLTDLATISGASNTRYINGPLAKIGTAAFFFPVGDGGVYLPVNLSGNAATPADFTTALPSSSSILVQPKRENPKPLYGNILTAPLQSVSSCLYWNITRGSGTGDIHVWLSIDQVNFCTTTGVNNADLRVAHLIGSPGSWQGASLGASGIVASGGASFIGSGTGYSVFSPFTLGSVSTALPVELTNFFATRNGNVIKLNWNTESEQNNAYFEVQRSADGIRFSTIGKVNGAGNSSQTIRYNFIDNKPQEGRNYYRLRQVDFDDKFALSVIVSENMESQSEIRLYPNPFSEQVFVQYPKATKGSVYRIIGMDGRVTKSGNLQENSTQMNINLGGLKSGSYILIIHINGDQFQQRILKQ